MIKLRRDPVPDFHANPTGHRSRPAIRAKATCDVRRFFAVREGHTAQRRFFTLNVHDIVALSAHIHLGLDDLISGHGLHELTAKSHCSA